MADMQQMQQWEYLEATVDLEKKTWKDSAGRERRIRKRSTVDVLNELGEEGWELAGVSPLSGDTVSRLYFKRRRPPEPPGAPLAGTGR